MPGLIVTPVRLAEPRFWPIRLPDDRVELLPSRVVSGRGTVNDGLRFTVRLGICRLGLRDWILPRENPPLGIPRPEKPPRGTERMPPIRPPPNRPRANVS